MTGVVAAPLTLEVAAIAVGFGFCTRAIICVVTIAISIITARVIVAFAHKALVARPGLDECSVHAEVLAREPVFRKRAV